MAVLPMLGRFGAHANNSPEEFAAGIEIQGTGPGKAATRHHKLRPGQRRERLNIYHLAELGQAPFIRKRIYDAMTCYPKRRDRVAGSMRGDAWLQENRRLRSAGLPQNRVEVFSDEWWRRRIAKPMRAI
jgi:hypothetical protein